MNSKLMKDIIYENRKKKQLTQEQLADLLNVSNKTVSKWERGLSYPDILLIPNLVKILDISINELFDTQDIKEEAIMEYDNSLTIKYKQSVLLSILLFVFSPLLLIIGSLGGSFEITLLGWVAGVGMIISSLIIFILSTSKYKKLIEEKFYNEKYILVLKNCFLFYLLLISLPLLSLVPSIFSNIIYSLIIIVSWSIIIMLGTYFLIIKKYNLSSSYILLILSLISYIVGIVLIICFKPYPYIILIILSIIIYFTNIFIYNKFQN